MKTEPENPSSATGGITLAAQLSRIRHDVRNPLSDILGFSEILQEEAAQAQRCVCGEDLRTIHQLAASLLEQVNQMLTPPRVQAGPETVTVLRQAIDECAQRIIGLAEAASLKCDETANSEIGDDLLRISSAARKLQSLSPRLLELTSPSQPSAAVGSGEAGDAVTPVSPAQGGHARSEGAVLLQPDHGHLLVVDDEESNRALLARRLRPQGYTVALAENGRQALAKLDRQSFDLILLDIMMPEMDGYAVLKAIKEHETHRHLPVIMTSAVDDLDSVVRCILRGADDYLTKPFDPVVLRARVGSSLEKKRLHDREQQTYQALLQSQQQLNAELAEAAAYVQSLLPKPLAGGVEATWQFLPSARLGGDVFDYFWLDADHLVIHLLDVCSHGVGAALLSVSVMNVLRSRALPDTDFRAPDAVLRALNQAFAMERHHNLYFTMWYGVYQRSSHALSYASGGHPPALFLSGLDRASARPEQLHTRGPVVGAMPGAAYAVKRVHLQPYNSLYVFSDGAYEIARPDGRLMTIAELMDQLVAADRTVPDPLEATVRFLQTAGGDASFEDDLSLLRLCLGEGADRGAVAPVAGVTQKGFYRQSMACSNAGRIMS
jgi:sigma-B regulation protein RsbU (phosphoserine phosphatase)